MHANVHVTKLIVITNVLHFFGKSWKHYGYCKHMYTCVGILWRS